MHKAEGRRRLTASGYLAIDKNRTVPLADIVAIVNKKNGRRRTEVVLRKDIYNTTTNTQTLLTRVEGGKKR